MATKRSSRSRKRPYNPGMNPFVPLPSVRYHGKLGAPGTVYEFNVKLLTMRANITEEQLWDEVRSALATFQVALMKKFPWVGEVYFTGRSAGWLAIQDPKGQMTMARLVAMSKMVEASLDRFKARIVKNYPLSHAASGNMRRGGLRHFGNASDTDRPNFINGHDDMEWLRDVHLPKLDIRKYKSAIVYGNEDYPTRIDVFESRDPQTSDGYVTYKPNPEGDYQAVAAVHGSTQRVAREPK